MRSIEKSPAIPAKHRPLDPTLVRHIYDIHEIDRLFPTVFANALEISKLMRLALEKDATDFLKQHPDFANAPVGELKWAMEEAASNPEIEAAYQRFIKVMVYGDQKPDFRSALATFNKRLSEACAPHNMLSFEHL